MVSNAGPGRHLPVFQALLITLGMGDHHRHLKTAPTVALRPEHLVWVLGGVNSMIGALCFAENGHGVSRIAATTISGAQRPRRALMGFVRGHGFSVMHTGWITLSAFMFAIT